ncbi:hypothetical protein ACFZ8E_07555 [Methylobacterium sp. HMF5984]|uniref:hypothetical protein n=1 Tax=Methylobacterium sp. HMF5984 TaxID=3367370 RepID=UPI0038532E85
MARYQVRDIQSRKINIIEWDGKSPLGPQYHDCSITLDDGLPMYMIPPLSVSRRQMMLALNAQGKLVSVNAIVASADIVTQLSWSGATAFDRTDALVTVMAKTNGWTDADLDDLFLLAGTF